MDAGIDSGRYYHSIVRNHVVRLRPLTRSRIFGQNSRTDADSNFRDPHISGYLSVNSPELFFGLFRVMVMVRVRIRVRVRVNSVTETNIVTEKNNSGESTDKYTSL